MSEGQELQPSGVSNTLPATVASPRNTRIARSKEEVDRALELVADWVLNRASEYLEEEVEKTVASVIRDHATRLRIMLVGLSKRRVLNLMELSSDLDDLEDYFRRMVQTTNQTPLALPEMVKVYNALAKREKTLLESVAEVAESGYPTKLESSIALGSGDKLRLEEAGGFEVSPTQRDKIRSLITGIRQSLLNKGLKEQDDGTFPEEPSAPAE